MILASFTQVKSVIRLLSTTSTVSNAYLSPYLALEDLLDFLKECKSLHLIRSVHQQALTRGLLNVPQGSCFSLLGSNIVGAYVSCNALVEALHALEIYSCSSIFWWNNIIMQDVRQGHSDHALYLCCRMQHLGTKPDHFTFPFLLKACGEYPSLRWGVSIHAVICSNGFESNVFVCNGLVAMYARCGALRESIGMFEEIVYRGIDDVVSWNSVVAANVQRGNMHSALETFKRMTAKRTLDMERKPDVISLVNILPACASLKASSEGKQIHGFALRNGLLSDLFVGNAMVDVYAKCDMMADALKVFNTMRVRDVVSWNVMVSGYVQSGKFVDALSLLDEMHKQKIELNVVTWSAVISGYAQSGHSDEAIGVFRKMVLSGSAPNDVTLISLLSACASVGALLLGMEIHGYALRRCLVGDSHEGHDRMVTNALVDMYSKCKNVESARALFNLIPLSERNVVTWTVMIGGYAQHGDANAALQLLSTMLLHSTVYPNEFTISCTLMASARLSALHFAKQIHNYVVRNGCDTSVVFVGNCLIDTYSKCGDINAAQKVFTMMPVKNSVSWTSLMTGYGMHSQGNKALTMFQEMRDVGITPDVITFLVVLYACNHSGMVDQGLRYFRSMSEIHGLVAGVEHYACVVDLLGRAGRLREALKLIEEMPMKPTMIVWVALLGACRIHSNLELAQHASKRLLELNSENDGSYTLLSNIYANASQWNEVARIRSLMKKNGVKKRPGCSWIQGQKGTSTFAFFVGDRSHQQSQQINAVLTDLMQRIKAIGYVPQTDFALHDVDYEEKLSLLSQHSEKLALAFGVLTYPPGLPIRITKNLRVCGDCHSAFVYISKIVDHVIILRDSSRFHHFNKGSCSCGGYW